MSLTVSRRGVEVSRGRRRGARRWIPLLALVTGVLVVRTLVVGPMQVASHSMEPTLAPGDAVLVTRFAPGRVDRGDMVVFEEPGSGRPALKRVVGLPGESIVIKDSVLHVDGRPQMEAFVDHTRIDGYYSRTFLVPAEHVLLLGDNRGNSVDSRDYGPVPMEALRGRVVLGLWPLGGFEDRGRPPKP